MKLLNKISAKLKIGEDKILHFIICFVITFIGAFLHFLFAIIITLIIAFYKEFIDSHKPGNYWSWRDILADTLGCLLAVLIHLIFNMLWTTQ